MKVKAIDKDSITFDNGVILTSDHSQDCCESHYLDFSNLKLEDFEDLNFDIEKDDFFERVPNFGIRLLPTNGQPISIPGYGYNNGYYGSNIDLVLSDGRRFDVSECQVISD